MDKIHAREDPFNTSLGTTTTESCSSSHCFRWMNRCTTPKYEKKTENRNTNSKLKTTLNGRSDFRHNVDEFDGYLPVCRCEVSM